MLNTPPQDNPLAQLRDIHTPDPISWWPLAPGWWVLLVLALTLIVIVLRLIIKRKNKITVSKVVNQQLEQLKSVKPDKQHLVNAGQLLRRVALTRFARKDVASIPLSELIDKLSRVAQINIAPSSRELLNNIQYMPETNIDETQWRQLVTDLEILIEQTKTLSYFSLNIAKEVADV